MRAFQASDIVTVRDWMSKRRFFMPAPEFLPPTGLIVDNCACGFLVMTNCNIGIFDYFMTNPEVDKQKRFDGLYEIALALLDIARRAGLKKVYCDTTFGNIKQLAHKMDFSYLGESSSFCKEL